MRLKLQSRHLSLRTKLIWLFVVIKVLPLLLLAVLAWEGFRLLGDRVQRQTEQLTGDVRLTVGGMAETLSRQAQEALNARAREELERLTTDTARRVAEFLYSRDVDIQQAARLAPSPAMYSLFMAGRTRHLVDARVLAALGPKGYLINVARGSVVDEAALVQALANGTIAGAGLDVFEREPAVPEALWSMEQVVLTPHIGSATHETRQAMAALACDNLRARLAGQAMPTPVPECAQRAGR